MSNAKIRHWIYLALGFLILCSGAWFLLLRESKLTEEYLETEIMPLYQKELDAVTAYLTEAGGENFYDINGVPGIDNSHFNVPTEDSDAYRSYNSAVITLLRTNFSEIIYQQGVIHFVTPRSGGLLHSDYMILAYHSNAPMLKGAPRTQLSQPEWSYYIVTEKDA